MKRSELFSLFADVDLSTSAYCVVFILPLFLNFQGTGY